MYNEREKDKAMGGQKPEERKKGIVNNSQVPRKKKT